MEYREYLKSDKWRKKKRKLRKKLKHKQCVVCFTPKGIDTHHLTYKHIFKEKIGDLIFLCQKHHEQIHEIIKEKGLKGRDALIELKQIYLKEIIRGRG